MEFKLINLKKKSKKLKKTTSKQTWNWTLIEWSFNNNENSRCLNCYKRHNFGLYTYDLTLKLLKLKIQLKLTFKV